MSVRYIGPVFGKEAKVKGVHGKAGALGEIDVKGRKVIVPIDEGTCRMSTQGEGYGPLSPADARRALADIARGPIAQ